MSALPEDGRVRAVVASVAPIVDGGRFAVKRVVGDHVIVEADCYADGHDVVAARVRWRREGAAQWHEAPMTPIGNDRWRGRFVVDALGAYRYTVCAWVDPLLSWRHDFARRVDAEDIRLAALAGAQLVAQAAARAAGDARARLAAWADRLRAPADPDALRAVGLDEALAQLAARHPDRRFEAAYPVELPLVVDPAVARFGAWYELFPRSASPEPGRHGTFRDVEARLPYVADMGFDVLYLPPIHPVGREKRKGPDNALVAGPDDVGSPWAVGAAEGGHSAIHPALGTLEDFRSLVAKARSHGLALALDIAFQCAPDHPYVATAPQWFRRRADGTIQYAENPPKRYQDIYPFDFESEDWRALWEELKGVFEFWIAQGVTIFRVDNPHTKAFAFWEWAIAALKRAHPELVFLAEAFTRPRVMHHLAKAGFTQSYTYFAWRNTRQEIEQYFTELSRGPGREYFRPNVWPNTPDILTEYLQLGGRPAFVARAVLAATLAASYGIYGPAFELCESEPREPGSEEYLRSEKYELRHWDLDRAESLAGLIGRLNRIRRDNPALQSDEGLAFMPTDNDRVVCYAKCAPQADNAIVVAVNLDPQHAQSAWVELDLDALGLDAVAAYQMHELLTGARFLWSGARNFIRLDPQGAQAQVFRVRRRVRSERDFDYFL
jgi:starch synthase (maltosyl-transferring)